MGRRKVHIFSLNQRLGNVNPTACVSQRLSVWDAKPLSLRKARILYIKWKWGEKMHVASVAKTVFIKQCISQAINHQAPLAGLTPADRFVGVGGITIRESKEGEGEQQSLTQKRAQDKHRQSETKRRKFFSL